MATKPSTQKTATARSSMMVATSTPSTDATPSATHSDLFDNSAESLAASQDVMATRLLQLQDQISALHNDLEPVLVPLPDTFNNSPARTDGGTAPMVDRMTSLCDQVSTQIWRLHQMSRGLAVASPPSL